jgi:hypothetical protein
MRGIYTVSFDQQTIAAASGDYDFFELRAATDKPIEVMAIYLGNKSEVGDAQEEMVAWSIVRHSGGTFTSGNGTAATPRALDPSDGAASFTAETVGSTPASTSGTAINLHVDTFNIRTGLQIIFPPDMRPKLDGGAQSALLIRMLTALADDATLSGTVYVREL